VFSNIVSGYITLHSSVLYLWIYILSIRMLTMHPLFDVHVYRTLLVSVHNI